MSQEETYELRTGHALELLKQLPDESAQAVVTSPPYYGLRSYSTEPAFWGVDPACTCDFDEDGRCPRCLGWVGELGQEPSSALFIDHLVMVFAEVRRVLRHDGVCFLNIGDTYNSYPANRGKSRRSNDLDEGARPSKPKGYGLLDKEFKLKDLLLVPARLALALQADGWYVRQDVIWGKAGGNCPRCYYRIERGSTKPESAKDRFTRAHEYVWMLTKSDRYHFDDEAVKEGHNPAKRRDVLYIAAQSFRGAHTAVMPLELATVLVRGATSAHGACSSCGAPFKRLTEKKEPDKAWQKASGGGDDGSYHGEATKDYETAGAEDPSALKRRILSGLAGRITTGWKQTCSCPPAPPKPCLVLDPFSGAGTTGVAALQSGCSYIGLERDEVNNLELAGPRLDDTLAKLDPTAPRDLLPPESNIYFGRAEELLHLVPPASVRLILTDPPYNTSRVNNFHTMGRTGIDFSWDGDFDQEEWVRLADGALMPGGSVVIWNDWKNLGILAHLLMDLGYSVKRNLIWLKTNPMPRNKERSIVQKSEMGLWAVKPGAKWVFHRAANRHFEDGVYVYGVPRARKDRARHETKKPDELFQDIIRMLSDPDDLVLDPFSGGGTTAFAAHTEGRRHISFENDPAWYAESLRHWGDAGADVADALAACKVVAPIPPPPPEPPVPGRFATKIKLKQS